MNMVRSVFFRGKLDNLHKLYNTSWDDQGKIIAAIDNNKNEEIFHDLGAVKGLLTEAVNKNLLQVAKHMLVNKLTAFTRPEDSSLSFYLLWLQGLFVSLGKMGKNDGVEDVALVLYSRLTHIDQRMLFNSLNINEDVEKGRKLLLEVQKIVIENIINNDKDTLKMIFGERLPKNEKARSRIIYEYVSDTMANIANNGYKSVPHIEGRIKAPIEEQRKFFQASLEKLAKKRSEIALGSGAELDKEALLQAICYNDREDKIIEFLSKNPAYLGTTDENGSTLLMLASKKGMVNLVKHILEKNATVTPEEWRKALENAAFNYEFSDSEVGGNSANPHILVIKLLHSHSKVESKVKLEVYREALKSSFTNIYTGENIPYPAYVLLTAKMEMVKEQLQNNKSWGKGALKRLLKGALEDCAAVKGLCKENVKGLGGYILWFETAQLIVEGSRSNESCIIDNIKDFDYTPFVNDAYFLLKESIKRGLDKSFAFRSIALSYHPVIALQLLQDYSSEINKQAKKYVLDLYKSPMNQEGAKALAGLLDKNLKEAPDEVSWKEKLAKWMKDIRTGNPNMPRFLQRLFDGLINWLGGSVEDRHVSTTGLQNGSFPDQAVNPSVTGANAAATVANMEELPTQTKPLS
jgi:hypothetical protein